MGNRRIYETLDRSFRDLLKNDLPFGDKLILFSGNWNQCLPVVPNADRANIVAQTMKASCLWDHVQHLRLIENMRVKNEGETEPFFPQADPSITRLSLKDQQDQLTVLRLT